ncbi:L-type lectin-domain containing receptor kinase IX.1-like isoform X2 [Rhodamnia argentea]|uniref:non-specific serine/threonine protein kinase n=1 Tax=Rhodamnia argentea TaxID=178133 RepID=A0ABM3HED7_9MYRT|nr:L-type lectin-domain containing receptor kinase IX.1-like isoform X2 [Rhodamnia argentea]
MATAADGSVVLTEGYTPPYFQVGHITYSKPIDLWDSVTGRQADFFTRFSFTIDTFNPTEYSDGIAFFLAPVGFTLPPNSGGAYFGLFNVSTVDAGPRNQIVTVEFDTWVNEEFDPPKQHIGINQNSLSSLVYAGWNAASHSGNATDVVVTYDSTSKNLSVFWSFDDKPVNLDNKSSSLSCQIDLAKVLPKSVAIGFSASFGVLPERHSINSWEFISNLDVVRPPSADTSKKGVNYKMYMIITFITAPVACLLLVISAGSCLFMIKTRKKYEFRALTHIDKEIVALPLKFSYQELLVATSGFASDRRLGQGGSGQVYQGFLNRLDRLVAVKRIFAKAKHSEKVFTNEVKIISRMIHRNLVQFIGWCQEEGEFLLVYEYMSNGSLDNHLFGTRKSLPWDVRYKIASGLALALNYLHEDLEQCVLHRDIKAANILLDTNFNTKLGDFGVAKLVDPRFRTQTTDVVGTYGYLAPEYLSDGKVTKESDMFSFGVVALEIACGRRTYQEGEYHVPLQKWVWQLYLAGNMLEAVDETLGSSFDRKEMECLMRLGLWCVHPDPKRRPKAGKVIRYLQQEAPVPELPPGTFEPPTSYQPSAQGAVSSCIEEFSSFSAR